MCALKGGYLPRFYSLEEFEELFYTFRGTPGRDKPFDSFDANEHKYSTILWGEASYVKGNLSWCNDRYDVPMTPQGSLGKPFFLVSYVYTEYTEPNLWAVPVATDILIANVYCMHSKQVVDECNDKKRKQIMSPIDSFFNKYNLKNIYFE